MASKQTMMDNITKRLGTGKKAYPKSRFRRFARQENVRWKPQ